MQIIPCGHRLLVKPHKIEELDDTYKRAKAAGIQLVESNLQLEQSAVDKGEVLMIGDTAFKDFGGEPWVKVGDQVAFARFGGKLIENPVTKEKLLLLNDEDIICKFVKE